MDMYEARLPDLGPDQFVKVECAAYGHRLARRLCGSSMAGLPWMLTALSRQLSTKREQGKIRVMPLRQHFAMALPLRFGSSQGRSRDEVALQVNVVDGGMAAKKSLRGSGRFDPLHLALSSADHLVGVFGAIVCPQPLLMTAGQAKVPEGRSIGAQLVGCQLFSVRSPVS
jgi:hypothetical protein